MNWIIITGILQVITVISIAIILHKLMFDSEEKKRANDYLSSQNAILMDELENVKQAYFKSEKLKSEQSRHDLTRINELTNNLDIAKEEISRLNTSLDRAKRWVVNKDPKTGRFITKK
jgi:ABC-type transporter Mla subunit MlaD